MKQKLNIMKQFLAVVLVAICSALYSCSESKNEVSEEQVKAIVAKNIKYDLEDAESFKLIIVQKVDSIDEQRDYNNIINTVKAEIIREKEDINNYNESGRDFIFSYKGDVLDSKSEHEDRLRDLKFLMNCIKDMKGSLTNDILFNQYKVEYSAKDILGNDLHNVVYMNITPSGEVVGHGNTKDSTYTDVHFKALEQNTFAKAQMDSCMCRFIDVH